MSGNSKNAMRFDKQIEYDGNQYLDSKMMCCGTKKDLIAIPKFDCFKGREVVVLEDEDNDKQMIKYVYSGEEWKPLGIMIESSIE